MSIAHYRVRDQLYTSVNICFSISILGISSITFWFPDYHRLFSLGIASAAILNVTLSALQYISDFGLKAASHERAAGLYAILGREREILSAKDEIDEQQLESIKLRLDTLAMTLPYPSTVFRDYPKALTREIEELEAALSERRLSDAAMLVETRQCSVTDVPDPEVSNSKEKTSVTIKDAVSHTPAPPPQSAPR